MEFGAFANAGTFDHSLSLTTGYGAGGRVGMFLDHRWALEFEDAEMRGSRPNGLRAVNVGLLSGRIVNVPLQSGPLSLLVGAGGGVSTETNFLHTYGVDVLAGAKIALRENVAFRVDGVFDWLANQNWKTYQTLRVGFSITRRPTREVRTVTVMSPAPPAPPAMAPPPMMIAHEDSVSADETRRLRARDAGFRALRDSLSSAPRVVPQPPATAVTSAVTLATMEAEIRFGFNKSDLTDSAKKILDDKVELFRANPSMTIVMLGYTDLIGTDAYNLALGTRRAEAAKRYIVARGIDAARIIIESKGDTQPVTTAPGIAAQAPNRRAIFRLLIVPGVIKPSP